MHPAAATAAMSCSCFLWHLAMTARDGIFCTSCIGSVAEYGSLASAKAHGCLQPAGLRSILCMPQRLRRARPAASF